jgi:hypothetical protein
MQMKMTMNDDFDFHHITQKWGILHFHIPSTPGYKYTDPAYFPAEKRVRWPAASKPRAEVEGGLPAPIAGL